MSFDAASPHIIICQDACEEIGTFADTIRAARAARLDVRPIRETNKEPA
jgi:hypothetical protein